MPDVTTLSVTCLCAEWCGTCREYAASFESLKSDFSGVPFTWYDVEDDADVVGDLDIETFPTLVIRRFGHVVFLGPVLPDPGSARRLIESYSSMSADQAATYAAATDERREWQELCDFDEPGSAGGG